MSDKIKELSPVNYHLFQKTKEEKIALKEAKKKHKKLSKRT